MYFGRRVSKVNFNLGAPKPFPGFPVKALLKNTRSISSLRKVQKWMEICVNQHKRCAFDRDSPSILPKRVLDVSSDTTWLYESKGEHENYICLSHCWSVYEYNVIHSNMVERGAVRSDSLTTLQSLESNKRGISKDTMPQTFQDAIDFTQRLGLKYIWLKSPAPITGDLY
jgi:hypothetical protein